MSWEIAAFLAVLLAVMTALGWAAALIKNALAYGVRLAVGAVRRRWVWRRRWVAFAEEHGVEFASPEYQWPATAPAPGRDGSGR